MVSLFPLIINTTSAVPVRNGPIAWPPVLLHAAFSRTTHPNNFTLNAALPWVLSNAPAKRDRQRLILVGLQHMLN